MIKPVQGGGSTASMIKEMQKAVQAIRDVQQLGANATQAAQQAPQAKHGFGGRFDRRA